MDLSTIDAQHTAYVSFLTSTGKSEHIREIDVENLSDFLNSVSVWNSDINNADLQIVRIGIYNTLRELESGQKLINSYLVGLDEDGVLVIGGGAGNDGPPHHP
jgi:hypothetical protein